jgi:hypothetical protein
MSNDEDKKTVFVSDEYGNQAECEMAPLVIDGHLVKLRAAGSRMTHWVRMSEYDAAADHQRIHNEGCER